jgi:polar amino acid transport system substrate-binding protein
MHTDPVHRRIALRQSHRAFAWLFAVCTLLPALASAAGEPARHPLIVTMQEYPPYIGQALPRHGMLTAVVGEALERAGISFELVSTPNNRSIEGVRLGIYNASFGWARSAERERDLYYSEALTSFRMVFCQRRGENYPWQTLADLSPWRIGVTYGNFYSDEFEQLVRQGKLTVDPANSDADSLHKLIGHRIDLFPMEIEAGPFLIQTTLPKAEREQLKCQDHVFFSVPIHIVVSRKMPDGAQLVERINKALDALHKSGEFERQMEDTRRAIAEQAAAQAK